MAEWTAPEAAEYVRLHLAGTSDVDMPGAMEAAGFKPRTERAYNDCRRRNKKVRALLFGEDRYEAQAGARLKLEIEEGKLGPVSRVLANRPRSAEEMAELFDIDTEAYKPRKIVTNQWGSNWQTKVWWELDLAGAIASGLWDELLEAIRTVAPPAEPHDLPRTGILYEILIMDAHLGQLSWAPEAGEDWDLSLAVEEYRTAFRSLLARAPAGTEKYLLVVGHDLFNFDTLLDKSAGATQRGTVQDIDTRWQKLFVAVHQVVVECIQEAAEKAQVDVIVQAGNHDYQSTFYLGELLQARFGNDPRISIDNTPWPRRYYRWGENLIGFAHGDEEKLKDLPGLMAEEQPEAWGATVHREWHTGDKHHEYVDEHSGVVVRIVPALAPKSAWATRKGYLSKRGARAFVWRKTAGVPDILAYNPRYLGPTSSAPLMGDVDFTKRSP